MDRTGYTAPPFTLAERRGRAQVEAIHRQLVTRRLAADQWQAAREARDRRDQLGRLSLFLATVALVYALALAGTVAP